MKPAFLAFYELTKNDISSLFLYKAGRQLSSLRERLMTAPFQIYRQSG